MHTIRVRSGNRNIVAHRTERDVVIYHVFGLIDEVVPERALDNVKSVNQHILGQPRVSVGEKRRRIVIITLALKRVKGTGRANRREEPPATPALPFTLK